MENRFDGSPQGAKEITEQIIFWDVMRKRLHTPEEWLKCPATLLEDLRSLETWRSELVTDNPLGVEEYKCEVHREKNLLFTLLKATANEMIVNLRAIQSIGKLPVSPVAIEQFARAVEAIQCGHDDAQCVYDLHRVLNVEIQTMEAFCRLNAGPSDPWSDGRMKRDWIAENPKLLPKQFENIRTKNPDRVRDAGGGGRGPWQFKKSLCHEFGLKCPELAERST